MISFASRFLLMRVTFALFSVAIFIACGVKADNEGVKSLPLAEALPSLREGNTPEKGRKDLTTELGDDDLDNILGLSVELSLDGEQAKVVSSAYNLFIKDEEIPAEKRRLENYKIEVRQTKKKYYILFEPKRALGEPPMLGGKTSLGYYTIFVFNKSDLSFVGRGFFK